MPGAVASSAYGPILLSALEQTLPEAARILDDPVAYRLLPIPMRGLVNALRWKPLYRLFSTQLEKTTPGIRYAVLSRKRYIAEKLADALDDGCEAVVILGSGLDTLAYRIHALSALHVYEVDLPENIAYKRKKLETLYGAVPSHVTLVPLDFQTQDLETALAGAGYTHDVQTFFIWEGVTQYLTEAAVRATLTFLSRAKPGSRMVFTYVLKDFIDGRQTAGQESLHQRMRVKNQYWRFGLHPPEIAGFIGEYGWSVLQQADANRYRDHYLLPTGRQGAIAELEPAVYAERATR